MDKEWGQGRHVAMYYCKTRDLTLLQKVTLLGNVLFACSATSLTTSFLAQFSTGANSFVVGE